MKNYKPRAIIYTRVSSGKQVENTSLEFQEKICKDYCDRNEYIATKVFVEEGESAKYTDRTQLKKALEHCSNKRNAIDFFVVYKFDRFSRSLENHVTIKAVLSRYNVTLTSATELTEDTPTGNMVENMLAMVAQFDNEVRAERATNGMKSKLSQGYWIFQPPTGYIKNMNSEQKPKPVIPHPDYFSPMQQAWRMYAMGKYGMVEVLEYINKQGVKTQKGNKIRLKALSKILRNRFYKGTIFCDNFEIEVKGKHDPMVDDVTFEKVQQLLEKNESRINKKGKTQTNPDFLLSKSLYCNSCGNMLTGCYSKGKMKYYGYYQCGNSKCKKRQYLPKDNMHEAFIKFLDKLKKPEDDMDLFLEIITDEYDRLYNQATSANKRIQKEIKKIQSKIDNLKDLVEDGTYTKKEYLERKRKNERAITVKKISLNETNIDIPEFETCKNNAKRFLEHLPTFWINLQPLQKRKMTNFLFEDGLIWDGKQYRTPQIHPVFKEIDEVLESKRTMVRRRGTSSNSFEKFLKELMTIRKLNLIKN